MSNAVVTDWPSGSGNAGWPQEPTGMLMPGRVQGWPAGTQRAANPAQRLLSQAVAWWDVEQYREGDRFLRNRGTGGELLDLRLGSAIAPNSNDPLYLAPEDVGYVYLPGGASSLSIPDENALDITGDIDIRVWCALDDWTPASNGSAFAKTNAGAGQRSWFLNVQTNGTLLFGWYADGTTLIFRTSTTATGIADGQPKWIRAILDVDNGASGHDVKFFTSDDGVTWTQIGNTVTTAGTTSIFSGTSGVLVPFDFLPGRVYGAQVWNGIEENGGTKVLDIDCDAITSGSATSFTAVTNQTVTINRSTAGRKSVAVPSRHKGGRPVFLHGTDDFLEVPLENAFQHGLLNFQSGDSCTAVIVVRQWSGSSNVCDLISKRASNVASSAGYSLQVNPATLSPYGIHSDGVTQIIVSAGSVSSGTLLTMAYVVNRPARTATTRLNAASGVGADLSGIAPNTLSFNIGRRAAGGTNYMDAEFYGAAIFRRALTAAEITLLSNYFTGRIA